MDQKLLSQAVPDIASLQPIYDRIKKRMPISANRGFSNLRHHLQQKPNEVVPSELLAAIAANGLNQNPDPGESRDSADIKWAPGARDGVQWFHTNPDTMKADSLAADFLKVVEAYCHSPNLERLGEIYRTISNLTSGDSAFVHNSFSLSAQGSPIFKNGPKPFKAAFAELGRTFAFSAPDSAVVKSGIALLSVSLGHLRDADFDDLLVLGRHDEFTFGCARVFYQIIDDPVPQLWELAIATKG